MPPNKKKDQILKKGNSFNNGCKFSQSKYPYILRIQNEKNDLIIFYLKKCRGKSFFLVRFDFLD